MKDEFYHPGKVISFRLPADTPERIVDILNRLKVEHGNSFSRVVLSILFEGLEGMGDESVSIPLPRGISEQQREWMLHPMTKAWLSGWLAQIVEQPELAFQSQKTESKPLEPAPANPESKEKPAGFSVQGSYLKTLASDLLGQN